MAVDDDDDKLQQLLNEPIPGNIIATRSVRLAVEFVCHLVEKDLGTNNGETALYWHLIHTIQKHIKKEPK